MSLLYVDWLLDNPNALEQAIYSLPIERFFNKFVTNSLEDLRELMGRAQTILRHPQNHGQGKKEGEDDEDDEDIVPTAVYT